MKVLSSLVFALLSTAAFADDPNPTAQCFLQARNSGFSVSVEQATTLCHGATSTEPVTCFVQARGGSLINTDQAVALCKPVLCGND